VNHLPAHAGLVGATVAALVLACGIVAAGSLGRRGGGLVPLAILLTIITANGAAVRESSTHWNRRTWAPTSLPTARDGLNLGAGDTRIDLTSRELVAAASTTNPVTIPIEMGAGRLIVVVPDGVGVHLSGSVGLGSIDNRLDGSTRGGAGVNQDTQVGGEPAMVVHARLGLGQILFVHQGTEVK
jgi:hypothetical protein